MPRVVFDIETVGVDFDSLDEQAQEYLLKAARTPEEKELVPEQLSFSPLTGQVVAIALLNPDTGKGAVYYQAPNTEPSEHEENGIVYSSGNEAQVLEKFWRTIAFYDQFITFNGRAFDCPFLMVRSAVNKVRPTKNLVPYRYGDEHIDLYDRLGFFGAVRRTMSLHMWCQAFGIRSSKEGGITGYEVPRFFKEAKYLDIARYCFDDIRATAELFAYWNQYINIK
ncbi:MAG: ribonuclease H-like domain-containing protein [Candidatus Yanofskybacteria bacterium]|nr:ribonuclease H-like domain-containing protein [Candidatus Yanofskybacteria bacterium]